MAELPDVFKASETEDTGFGTLPAGKYLAEIIKSEVKTTKAGDGKYISLQLKITEGKYTKRLVFDNLNIVNKNDVAVSIAKSTLKQICEACDVDELEDTEDLHNIAMCIQLGIQAETQQFPEKNIIKKYMSEDKYEAVDDGDDNPFEE